MLEKLLAIGGLVVALGGVVLYIKGWISNQVSLKSADATAQAEQSRVTAMEGAQAAARAERSKEFDAKVASVHTADDAAQLLKDVGHDHAKA